MKSELNITLSTHAWFILKKTGRRQGVWIKFFWFYYNEDTGTLVSCLHLQFSREKLPSSVLTLFSTRLKILPVIPQYILEKTRACVSG